MRTEDSFLGQPVRSLQTMLRTLAESDSRYASVIPDGIYGPQTAAAVSRLQRNHGLPVAAVADQATWETLVLLYDTALIQIAEAEALQIILNPNQVLKPGEESPWLYVAQALLTVLSQVYASIPLPSQNGLLDLATADAISSFQELSGLPMTGQLDKVTWKHLALQFPLAASGGKTAAAVDPE